MTISVEQLTTTLTDQHRHIKTLMETVVAREEANREPAFAELCRFLAAHEAAEEECMPTVRGEEVSVPEQARGSRSRPFRPSTC